MISDRFKELVNDYYTKPTDEEIFGSFLSIISDDSPVRTQKTLSFQREKKKQSTPEINVPGIGNVPSPSSKWPTKQTDGKN